MLAKLIGNPDYTVIPSVRWTESKRTDRHSASLSFDSAQPTDPRSVRSNFTRLAVSQSLRTRASGPLAGGARVPNMIKPFGLTPALIYPSFLRVKMSG